MKELNELSNAITAKGKEWKVNLAISDERRLHKAKLELSEEYEEKTVTEEVSLDACQVTQIRNFSI